MRVSAKNSLKGKNFQKGVEQLAQEGAIQVYRNEYNEIILGAVGVLQFEVFDYRLVNEYNTDIRMESLDFSVARWVKTDNPGELKRYENSRCMLVFDHYERPVLLFTNPYALRSFQDRYEDVVLVEALDVVEQLENGKITAAER
jgi:peptide chain release factor 3